MIKPVVAVVTALTLLGLTTGSAAPATLDGRWTMTLAPGSSVVVLDTIGSADLRLQGSYSPVPGAVGDAVRFRYRGGPALGTASSSSIFNPGTAPFAVAAYLRTPRVPTTGDYSPNVVQKGLWSADNGQWKMQLVPRVGKTIAVCRFAGDRLRAGDTVVDRFSTPLAGNGWHEVVCWRLATSYGITVDGRVTSVHGDVGSITSVTPLRIANKTPQAGVEDQFRGSLDCIAYAAGTAPRRVAEARVPC